MTDTFPAGRLPPKEPSTPNPSGANSGFFTEEARRDLDILGRDDFKTLAHAVVVRGYAAIVGLPMDIVAKLLYNRGVVVASGVIQ